MKVLDPDSFRPRFGVGLTIAIALIAVAAAIGTLIDQGFGAVVSAWPWFALLAGGCWAVFYHPRVDVDATGVRLVNVWHTIDVPWSALVGLETKWALTLVTAETRYRAWAAPAPGRTAMRSEHPNTHRLRDAAIGGEVRPGDLPNTDSGEAAALVRKHWRVYLRTLPAESDAEVESDAENGADRYEAERRAPIDHAVGHAARTFHTGQLAVAVVLAVLAAVGFG